MSISWPDGWSYHCSLSFLNLCVIPGRLADLGGRSGRYSRGDRGYTFQRIGEAIAVVGFGAQPPERLAGASTDPGDVHSVLPTCLARLEVQIILCAGKRVVLVDALRAASTFLARSPLRFAWSSRCWPVLECQTLFMEIQDSKTRESHQ